MPKQSAQPPTESFDMKFAKTRDWTPAEALAAKKYLEDHRPGLWADLLEIMKETGDFNDQPATSIAMRELYRFYPEAEGLELHQLS